MRARTTLLTPTVQGMTQPHRLPTFRRALANALLALIGATALGIAACGAVAAGDDSAAIQTRAAEQSGQAVAAETAHAERAVPRVGP